MLMLKPATSHQLSVGVGDEDDVLLVVDVDAHRRERQLVASDPVTAGREDLNAAGRSIGHVDQPVFVDCDARRLAEQLAALLVGVNGS